MKSIINFTLFVQLLVGTSAYAVGGDTRESELSHANLELNMIYQKVLNKIPSEDKANLKIAQKAWIHFRDLDCKWAFKAEPLDCLIDRTINRTKELGDSYY